MNKGPTSEPPKVAGKPLPGGRYRITPEENARFCEAVLAEVSPDGEAHPSFFFVAAQSGMGLSVDELLALCDFKAEDGPLLVNLTVELDVPLNVDTEYYVSGEIVALTRKPSRTFGIVDMLVFRLELAEEGGARAASVTNTWMLPRRGLVT